MRQVVGPGALGRPRRIGWRGRWEGGSGWGIHVTPWLIHISVWQKPLKYYKVISLQLIKINEKNKKINKIIHVFPSFLLWFFSLRLQKSWEILTCLISLKKLKFNGSMKTYKTF